MTTTSEVIEYSEIPARAKKVMEGFLPPEDKIAARVAELGQVPARPFDSEGDQEVLDGVHSHTTSSMRPATRRPSGFTTLRPGRVSPSCSCTESPIRGFSGITRWPRCPQRTVVLRST